MNLLINAAQSIDGHGKITIRTTTDTPWLVVQISDTGCGIPLENLHKLFDPFFTTKPVGEGTGLGLNISYGIVKAHKGTLDVDSVLGEGTTFTIRLPLKREKNKGGADA